MHSKLKLVFSKINLSTIQKFFKQLFLNFWKTSANDKTWHFKAKLQSSFVFSIPTLLQTLKTWSYFLSFSTSKRSIKLLLLSNSYFNFSKSLINSKRDNLFWLIKSNILLSNSVLKSLNPFLPKFLTKQSDENLKNLTLSEKINLFIVLKLIYFF